MVTLHFTHFGHFKAAVLKGFCFSFGLKGELVFALTSQRSALCARFTMLFFFFFLFQLCQGLTVQEQSPNLPC